MTTKVLDYYNAYLSEDRNTPAKETTARINFVSSVAGDADARDEIKSAGLVETQPNVFRKAGGSSILLDAAMDGLLNYSARHPERYIDSPLVMDTVALIALKQYCEAVGVAGEPYRLENGNEGAVQWENLPHRQEPEDDAVDEMKGHAVDEAKNAVMPMEVRPGVPLSSKVDHLDTKVEDYAQNQFDMLYEEVRDPGGFGGPVDPISVAGEPINKQVAYIITEAQKPIEANDLLPVKQRALSVTTAYFEALAELKDHYQN